MKNKLTITLLMCFSSVSMAGTASQIEKAQQQLSQTPKGYLHSIKKTLNPLIKQKSGMAFLILAKAYAKSNNIKMQRKYAYKAVEFGYPHKGYELVASSYHQNTTDSLNMASCYRNLATNHPDQAFLRSCMIENPNFKLLENKGIQTEYEAKLKAGDMYHNLCAHIHDSSFDGIDTKVKDQFSQLACGKKLYKAQLPNGRIMLDKNRLYQVDNNRLVPFVGQLKAGEIVSVKEPTYLTYIHNGKGLQLAKNNTLVEINSHTFYYENGKLVPKK
jgi:hypothetical protein